MSVTAGPDKGRVVDLAAGKQALIGRGANADLRLTDRTVSSKHCLVRAAGEMAIVEDQGSGNGTRVNGKKDAVHVLDGDGVIEIGDTVIDLIWVCKTAVAKAPLAAAFNEPTLPSSAATDPANTPTITLKVRKSSPKQRKPAASGPLPLADGSNRGASQPPHVSTRRSDFAEAQQLIGSTVGGCELQEVLGIGGMGAVYRARRHSNEPVALKLIVASHARNIEVLRRFLREARTGKALNHPNVVRTLASGEDGPYAYMIMELVEGRDIATLLSEGKTFTLPEAVAIVLPICDALSSAHVQAIIHRDIKPANIMLAAPCSAGILPARGSAGLGVPKLLDLGLAKKVDEKGQSILTATGDVMGTPQYMPPEQTTDSKHVDGRADIYSLAATLYAMLGSRPPFDGRTSIEVLRKVRTSEAPLLSDIRRDIPVSFAKIVAKAMAKKPDERYGSMMEFARAIKAGAGTRPAT